MKKSVKDISFERFYVDGCLRISEKECSKFSLDGLDSDVEIIDEQIASPPSKKLKKPTTSPYFQKDTFIQKKLELPLLAKSNKPTGVSVDDEIKEGVCARNCKILQKIKKRYTSWKKNRTFIYDYFTNHNIDENTCYSLEFGEVTDETSNNFTQQFFYLEYDSSIK